MGCPPGYHWESAWFCWYALPKGWDTQITIHDPTNMAMVMYSESLCSLLLTTGGHHRWVANDMVGIQGSHLSDRCRNCDYLWGHGVMELFILQSHKWTQLRSFVTARCDGTGL